MPLWVTIQPWSSAMNIYKQYGVYFVHHLERKWKKFLDLDRSAIGPANISIGSFLIARSVNINARTHFEQNFKALRVTFLTNYYVNTRKL